MGGGLEGGCSIAAASCLEGVPVLLPCGMPGSWFTAWRLPLAGLTRAPQAFAPSPGLVPAPLAVPEASLSRLIAALTSRPSTRPHASQQNVRSDNVRLGFRHPHSEHVLLSRYPPSPVTTSPPRQP